MNDHKLVMISIFLDFQNMRNMQFFNENKLGKFLGFCRMHENNFFKRKNYFKSFLYFFENVLIFF
jgi:hypothetical protein